MGGFRRSGRVQGSAAAFDEHHERCIANRDLIADATADLTASAKSRGWPGTEAIFATKSSD
jgi:hypothetical protein